MHFFTKIIVICISILLYCITGGVWNLHVTWQANCFLPIWWTIFWLDSSFTFIRCINWSEKGVFTSSWKLTQGKFCHLCWLLLPIKLANHHCVYDKSRMFLKPSFKSVVCFSAFYWWMKVLVYISFGVKNMCNWYSKILFHLVSR